VCRTEVGQRPTWEWITGPKSGTEPSPRIDWRYQGVNGEGRATSRQREGRAGLVPAGDSSRSTGGACAVRVARDQSMREGYALCVAATASTQSQIKSTEGTKTYGRTPPGTRWFVDVSTVVDGPSRTVAKQMLRVQEWAGCRPVPIGSAAGMLERSGPVLPSKKKNKARSCPICGVPGKTGHIAGKKNIKCASEIVGRITR